MHFEILVEDLSGKRALGVLLPKIVGTAHTFRIHAYKGIGRIPSNMTTATGAATRMLLTNLARLLQGYGRTYAGTVSGLAAVILVCDLDTKCLKRFRADLSAVLHSCTVRPETRFCIAIEEGEAWLLGDLGAIKTAYPRARDGVLSSYVNDSICGTWERLADAVYPGGASALAAKGWQMVGVEKSRWATDITPHMNVDTNRSPSFRYFRSKVRELAGLP